MDESLTITEENYAFWKTGAIISLVIASITFIVFLNIDDPFWVSIIRFTAFIFFALAVISYLQIMNGPIQVTLDIKEKVLLISYKKNGKIIHEEHLQRETIKNIFPTSSGINLFLSRLKPDIKAFKIHFTDTKQPLFLFEFSGRPLVFGPDEQEKITSFLSNIPNK